MSLFISTAVNVYQTIKQTGSICTFNCSCTFLWQPSRFISHAEKTQNTSIVNYSMGHKNVPLNFHSSLPIIDQFLLSLAHFVWILVIFKNIYYIRLCSNAVKVWWNI